MSLPDLPHELLLSIGDLLDRCRDINALARTNRQLYWHLNSYLYRLDMQATGGSVLIWAAKRGLKRTAWLSLAEGASIEAPHAVTMPPALGCLGFDSMTTYLTPLQIALCYGSDSVARLLIKLGAISSLFYPPELCSCTSLHMAAVMGLTSVMKILVAQGTYIDACDKQRFEHHSTTPLQCNTGTRQSKDGR